MTFLQYLKNLFTGYRPYNFVSKRLRARPQQKNNSNFKHTQRKPQKRFMSKHRYTHTTHKWNIGNTDKK